MELVVGPDFLDLRKGVEKLFVIPQADVLDRGLIVLDILVRQLLFGGELPFDDPVEAVGRPRVASML